MRLTWVLLLLLVPTVTVAEPIEASEVIEVTALAVAQTDDGFRGIASTVEARVLAGGSGQVYVDTKPLSETDMQASARLAARVAGETLGIPWQEFDFLVVMRSEAPIIGGPSAGAVMTLAFAAGLQDVAGVRGPWDLNPRVAATGTINPDGTIGPVGGVPAKAEGAERAGITTFLYPAGLEQAVTRTGSGSTAQNVVVDMDDHCDDLGIRCRPIATIHDLIETAAGVRIEVPHVEAQTTESYGELLSPSVTSEIARLGDRMDAMLPNGESADTLAAPASSAAAQAIDWLEQAELALSLDRYYQAATFAFRGHIQAGFAEFSIQFGAAPESTEFIEATLAACTQSAVDVEERVAELRPDDLTGWLAAGAAQERARHATELGAAATAQYTRATTINDWYSALHDASFCMERVRSSDWWASLGELFPASEVKVEDGRGLVVELLARAREASLYSQAVGVGSGGDVDEAQGFATEGWYPAATVAAIRAETESAIAIQQAVTGGVPPAILEAALDGANRAVLAARAHGVEPILSVSLLELAATEEGALALTSAWQARSLALLAPPPADPAAQWRLDLPFWSFEPSSLALVVVAFGLGGLMGAVSLGAAAAVGMAIRERKAAVAAAESAPAGHEPQATSPPAVSPPRPPPEPMWRDDRRF